MSGASARARWVARQITRAPVRSVLTALMAFLFSLALLWLRATIIHSQGEIEELYKSLKVDITIQQNLNRNTRGPDTISGVISLQKIDELKNEGLLQSAICRTSMYFDSMFPVANPEDDSPVFYDITRLSMLTNELNGIYCEPGDEVGCLPEIIYAPGHDESLFSRPWTEDDLLQAYPAPAVEPELFEQTVELFAQRQAELQELPGFSLPVVLPVGMMEQMEVSMGDPFYMFYMQTKLNGYIATAIPCVVVGTLTEGPAGNIACPLAPLHALETFASIIDRQMIAYDDVQLTVNPEKNAQISEVCDRLENILEDTQGQFGSWLDVTVWDEELQVVIRPLEQSYHVLSSLYPIAVLVSFITAIGASLLLALQKNKAVAILRVLGSSKAQVYRVLCAEQLVLVISGLFLAAALCLGLARSLLWPFVLTNALLYLIGTWLGTTLAAIFMLRCTPLALLQSRE